jgi:hypothetical protein
MAILNELSLRSALRRRIDREVRDACLFGARISGSPACEGGGAGALAGIHPRDQIGRGEERRLAQLRQRERELSGPGREAERSAPRTQLGQPNSARSQRRSSPSEDEAFATSQRAAMS